MEGRTLGWGPGVLLAHGLLTGTCPAWVGCCPIFKEIATAVFKGLSERGTEQVGLEEWKKGRQVEHRHSQAQ